MVATDVSNGTDPSTTALGEMPSMSAECTPLKQRYDSCFNRWFEEYLGLNESAPSSPQSSSSFWSSGSSSSSSKSAQSTGGPGGAQARSPAQRKALQERLNGECGAMWKEYQSCVLRAVKGRELQGLIDEARAHNPFPFPQDTPKGKPNNEPFPFPRQDR